MKALLVVGLLTMGMMQATVNAQSNVASQSSGTSIQQAINALISQGTASDASIMAVISQAIASQGVTLSPEALAAITKNKKVAIAFVTNLLATGNVSDATKLTIENSPADASSVVGISVALFPEQAQETMNAAVVTGEISSSDALLTAISAGADPTSVSEATAAGGTPAAAPVVAGAGTPDVAPNGAGSGNEDPSNSNS
jgi:hypothetical protein